ncbi:hypothetical protein B4U79_18736, partial [Dinothrombium tinctorium]
MASKLINDKLVKPFSSLIMNEDKSAVTKFCFTWKVPNFSSIHSSNLYLNSNEFSPPNVDDKWFMRMRLKNYGSNSEFLCVQLLLKSCDDRAKRNIRRFTYTCEENWNVFNARRFAREGQGAFKLAPKSYILDPFNEMILPDGCIKIMCEISLFEEANDQKNERKKVPFTTYGIGFNLWQSMTDWDTMIVARDGKALKSHKIILKAASP